MSKEDTAPGLLSKMVKFVRNPTTNWADLDQEQAGRDDLMSKQLLKEMIERKRRNDFVRKREFDMLRKMRKREVSSGSAAGDGAGRPSFFQSSLPSKPDDRATTLKKIDEIEAQMSMQWWKTKHGSPPDSSMLEALGSDAPPGMRPTAPVVNGVDKANGIADARSANSASGATGASGATAPGPTTSGAPFNPQELPAAYRPTEPATLQSMQARSAAPPASLVRPVMPLAQQPDRSGAPAGAALSGVTGAPGGLPNPESLARPVTGFVPPGRAAGSVKTPATPSPVSAPYTPVAAALATAAASPASAVRPLSPPSFSNAMSDFSHSKFTSVEMGGAFTHDTELEEAAIRFANGDDSGAEAGLLEILAPGGLRTGHADTWLTLFDLYRATAQQDKFESAAIGFVERFNRSAPQWFSMPDMVKMLIPPEAAKGNGPVADWVCPSSIGTQTVVALKLALVNAAPPWRLDWRNFKNIDAAAVEPLCRVFSGWGATASQLRFIGEGQLQKVLEADTPSGDRSTAQNRWQLRMETLRVMNRADDFEMAALDFCVTYEVSPPSWESARCQYRAIDPQGGPVGGLSSFIGDVYREDAPSRLLVPGDIYPAPLDSTVADSTVTDLQDRVAIELSGQVQGDAIAILDKVDLRLGKTDGMPISCAKLIRVDFSAAGTLLNWVAARQSEGRPVRFTEVNRLVAAFFNLIGITEHASVTVRID